MLPLLFLARIICKLPFARVCPPVSAEQVITVPLRSAVALSVDIVDKSGRDEFSFRDLKTCNIVRFVDIGVAISAVPRFESPLLNTNGYGGMATVHRSMSVLVLHVTFNAPLWHVYSTPICLSSKKA